MPALNAEKYIKRAIQSVISQTFEGWELIIVDDGSTDSTAKIITEYSKKYNSIFYYRIDNTGSAKIPRDCAIYHAKNRYVLFLDSDDYLEQNYLQKVWKRHIETNADVVLGKMCVLDSKSMTIANILPSSDYDCQNIYDGKDLVKDTLNTWKIGFNGALIDKAYLEYRLSYPKQKCDVWMNSDEVDSRYVLLQNPKVGFADAIYYYWLTNIIKRKCDYEELAETLILCREDKCIPNIDSINTFFCNLKCKECSNGIQYRKEKKKIAADSQIYYLKKMTDKLPISQCNFQGGEVFTDVNFSEFIEKHSYNSRVAIFTVATNGTILPKDDVFEVIRNTGCMIRISDYGILSKHKQDIIEKCKEFNIPCFTFPMAEKWRKFGEYKKRNRSESELREICSRCCFGTHDLMFVDNKISHDLCINKSRN